MDRFLQLFGRFGQFSYACWDRIVLRGYDPRLQRPENIVHIFHYICGDAPITPTVLARRTATYRRWLKSYTEQHRIPILTGAQGLLPVVRVLHSCRISSICPRTSSSTVCARLGRAPLAARGNRRGTCARCSGSPQSQPICRLDSPSW